MDLHDGTPANPISLDCAMRAAPHSAHSQELQSWLDELDEARWERLLVELRSIARSLSTKYVDVLDEDDIVSELAVLTYDRWLPLYRRRLAEGRAEASLRAFLSLRLRGHLHEMRRKRHRRALLASAKLPSSRVVNSEQARGEDAVFVGRTDEPDASLFADEIIREVSADPEMRAVLALRYAGFSQREIAGMLRMSRPSVSRRVAVIASLVATMLAVGLIGWWAAPRETSFGPDGLRPPPPRPAGVPETPRRVSPTSEPRPREEPAPRGEPPLVEQSSPMDDPGAGLSSEQIGAVVRHERLAVQRCYEAAAHATGRAPALRLDARLTIPPSGRVGRVDVWGSELSDLRPCVERAIRRWRFPRSGGTTTASVPFVFVGRDRVD